MACTSSARQTAAQREASRESRDRLGNGDSARGASGRIDPEPGETKLAAVEAPTIGDGVMPELVRTPRIRIAADLRWLAARSRGSIAGGAVMLHAPSFAFQAPGGGENQLIQTGRHLEALGTPIRLFSAWTDRIERARLLHL